MVSLGVGAMITAVMAVVTALTLLPAVLALLGHRVNKGKIRRGTPGGRNRFWEGAARIVIARPALMAGIGFVILLTLAAPALGMRMTFSGAEALPADNEFRVATEIAVDEFGMGQANTVVVVENATALTAADRRARGDYRGLSRLRRGVRLVAREHRLHRGQGHLRRRGHSRRASGHRASRVGSARRSGRAPPRRRTWAVIRRARSTSAGS